MFNVTLRRAVVEVAFEVGSLEELSGMLEEKNTTLRRIISQADELAGDTGADDTATAGTATTETTADGKPTARRGRKSNAEKEAEAKAAAEKAAATAAAVANVTAPPPLAIPGADAAATASNPPPLPPSKPLTEADKAAGANGIPNFLDRTKEGAAPPPPLPGPPTPPAPPAASIVPPSGILAGKMIAKLDELKAQYGDGGVSLVAWLSAPSVGLVQPNASYDEAVAVIRLQDDAKLANAATALAVS